jgi:hypothetical protein
MDAICASYLNISPMVLLDWILGGVQESRSY